MPLIWPIAVLAAIGLIAAWPWFGRATAINAGIVAVVPGVVLIPWTFRLFTSASAFLLEAGIQRPGLASAGLRPESVLLLSPGGPGLPPAWVTAGLVLPAFFALLARRRMPVVYAGWAIALGGLVVALLVSRVRITTADGTAISAWPGVATAVAAVGLLLAASPLIEAAGLVLRRTGAPARRKAAAATTLAVLASAPLLAAGYWLATGVRGPLAAAGPQILPPFVASSSTGPGQARTLVLRPGGPGLSNTGLSYTVLRSTDPVLGEPELTEASSATHALNTVVASLDVAAGADGGDAGQALSEFDIGYVLLPAPVDQALARRLDGAAGLVRLTTAPAYDLWQVAGTVARARVSGANGATTAVPSGAQGVNTTVPAGTSGTLVLAEAAGGWSATLNGRPLARLTRPVDGWAQGFVLPPGGGHLVITRDELARNLSLGAEAAALLIVFALALPGTRSAVPAPAAEPADEPRPATRRRRDRARPPKPAPAPAQTEPAQAEPAQAEPAQAEPAQAELAPTATVTEQTITLAAGTPPWIEAPVAPDPAPDPDHAPDRDRDPDRGPATAPTPALAAVPARRPRGGQHAARHGKPARRWRGPAKRDTQTQNGHPEDDRQHPTLETIPADEQAPDPMTTGSHAPWESGDRP